MVDFEILTNFVSKLHFAGAAQWESACLLACVRPWVPNTGNRDEKKRKGKGREVRTEGEGGEELKTTQVYNMHV